ncbi:hypothetical protein AMAG_19988 [Allomyces macrogynus ATCC 38327]|uniref:Uncharacterized protein n=1 Tax=Allomyces macrogynus (strain ATCC 38327) TaxID=578462 RepID=A0A0L0T4S4_ALLM3|nr:hypothetical protein AMAG_19988 [Allomyces macrogynus ATCC 38327]|eukprot:KNE69529.1 hypothetical protein AMAG_19988 [Allomyces macrogynus ATCC 38327]
MGNPQRVSKRHLKRTTTARLHMGVHRDCPHECCHQTPPHAARRIDLHRRAMANFSARAAANTTGINPITQPTRPLRGITNRDLDLDLELDRLLSASRPVTASPLQVPGSGSGSASGTGTPAGPTGAGSNGGPFRLGLRPSAARNPTRPLRGITNRDLDLDLELDRLLSASRPVTASPLQVPGSGSGSAAGTGTPAGITD